MTGDLWDDNPEYYAALVHRERKLAMANFLMACMKALVLVGAGYALGIVFPL